MYSDRKTGRSQAGSQDAPPYPQEDQRQPDQHPIPPNHQQQSNDYLWQGPVMAREDVYEVHLLEDSAQKRPRLITRSILVWLILSIILLGGGIALMIVSKVLQDQCFSQCAGDTPNSDICQEPRCNEILQSAFLNGGAVILSFGCVGIAWQVVRFYQLETLIVKIVSKCRI